MGQIAEASARRSLVAGYIEPTMHGRFVHLARAEDRSVSAILRRALLHELERVNDEEEAT